MGKYLLRIDTENTEYESNPQAYGYSRNYLNRAVGAARRNRETANGRNAPVTENKHVNL